MREFQTRLEARGPGGSWIFITLPFDAAAAFGGRGRVPVAGSINGIAFRSSLLPVGDGTHRLAVNKPLRAAAGADAGDLVDVVLDRDDAPRTVDVPDELRRALDVSPAARAAFDGFAISHRKAYVDWVGSAKAVATRERRAEKAVTMLVAGKKLA